METLAKYKVTAFLGASIAGLLMSAAAFGFEQNHYALFQIVEEGDDSQADGRVQVDASVFETAEQQPKVATQSDGETPSDVTLDFTQSTFNTRPSGFESFELHENTPEETQDSSFFDL